MRVIAFGPGTAAVVLILCGTAMLLMGNSMGWVLVVAALISMLALWVERVVDERNEDNYNEMVKRVALYSKAFMAMRDLDPMDMGDGDVTIKAEAWDKMEDAVRELAELGELPEMPEPTMAPVTPEELN